MKASANPFERRSNPFENDIVREPRDVSFSVAGLNDAALNAVVERFSLLDAVAAPRAPLRAPVKAQLVVSPDRGYGKSHLLGRLFAKLDGRATTIYLRPFQDPNKAWQSILSMSLRDLTWQTEEKPSPLELLALGVLVNLGADSLAEPAVKTDPDAAGAAAFLREIGADPTQENALNRPWIEYLTHPSVLADSVRCLRRRLRVAGANLGGRERAWVAVLAALAREDRDGDVWDAALRWLRGEPLEPDEARQLGVDPSDNDGRGDAAAQEIDALCFQRLRGLCVLAGFHRPFLFCFDQTEFFVGDPALIKTFGKCIEQLVAVFPHQLTVITANQSNWSDDILPHMEPPHRERIHPEPLQLEGVRANAARELIAGRLKRGGFDDGAIAAFFADDWLESVFATLPELGARDVLMRAAERFRALAKHAPPPPVTIEALFDAEVAAARADKSRQAYDEDALLWFVRDVGQGLAGVSVARTTGHRYFSLQWAWPERRIVFAFEGGDHWNRWKSIAEEATALADRDARDGFSAFVLRTPDLPRVPRPSWTTTKRLMDAARARGFMVVELTAEQVCELYAARELYSNALQGNIAYAGPQTLAWLQARFAAFLNDLTARAGSGVRPAPEPAATTPAAPDCPLDPEQLRLVVDLVRQQRVVSLKIVLERLGGDHLRDALLQSVELHPNLKAHPGPTMTFLQWRNAR